MACPPINLDLLNARLSFEARPRGPRRRCSRAVIRHKSQLVARCDDIIPYLGYVAPARPAGLPPWTRPHGEVRPRCNSPINRFCILATQPPPPSRGRLLRSMIDTVKYGVPDERDRMGARSAAFFRPIVGPTRSPARALGEPTDTNGFTDVAKGGVEKTESIATAIHIYIHPSKHAIHSDGRRYFF